MLEDKKANKIIYDYFTYKIDLQTLHTKLYKHFANYKKAVEYLADNEKAIISIVNKKHNKDNLYINIPPLY